MNYTLTLVLGAFLLATWCDTRFEQLRPSTIQWRIGHLVAAGVTLQLGVFGAAAILPEGAGLDRQLVAVFALLLPVFVYTFLAALWLLRSLAEVGFARR
jgi:hypothetical protein